MCSYTYTNQFDLTVLPMQTHLTNCSSLHLLDVLRSFMCGVVWRPIRVKEVYASKHSYDSKCALVHLAIRRSSFKCVEYNLARECEYS